jgi:hypothetical protein
MTLSSDEIVICNQALDRIASKNFTYATQATDIEGIKCSNIYEQTRDSLLRSYNWPFARARAELDIVQTLTLDSSPVSAWSAGATITGMTSYATATIISATSDVEYEIAYLSDDFDDAEFLTDGDVEVVAWEGIPLEYEDETVLWYDTGNDVQCGTGYPDVADSTPAFEWDYKYLLPEDYIRLTGNYTITDDSEPTERCTVEGGYLLSNDNEAEIRYVKKVTDPDDFDPLFTEVLILTLAKKLIAPLAGTKSPSLVEEIGRELSYATAKARTVCGTEVNTTGASKWNNARYGSGKV